MNQDEFYQSQIKQIKEQWFDRHIAKKFTFFEDDQVVEKIIWKRPDSGIMKVNYLVSDGCLMVNGDLGEQMYAFYREISLGGFGDNYSYYLSKAHNIDGYCKLTEINSKYGREWLEETANNMEIELPEDWQYHIEHEHELIDFLCENDIEPEDAWTLAESTKCFHMRALSHFVGLDMANQQLEN